MRIASRRPATREHVEAPAASLLLRHALDGRGSATRRLYRLRSRSHTRHDRPTTRAPGRLASARGRRPARARSEHRRVDRPVLLVALGGGRRSRRARRQRPCPGAALARAIAGRIVCALELSATASRSRRRELVLAYGDELAALVPQTRPADPLRARDARAAGRLPPLPRGRLRRGRATGSASALAHRRARGGVHPRVDCRAGSETPPARTADCSGSRGRQPLPAVLALLPRQRHGEGAASSARDPRGLQRGRHAELSPRRLGVASVPDRRPGGAWARASSHHAYGYELGGSGLGAGAASVYVSGGSHAGTVLEPREFDRHDPAPRLGLIPLEPIAAGERARVRGHAAVAKARLARPRVRGHGLTPAIVTRSAQALLTSLEA